MKTGIISDIHSNFDGLLCAVNKLRKEGVNRIICLGDLVDGGTEPSKVIKWVQGNVVVCVQGNHDACNNESIDLGEQAWLAQLPIEYVEDDLIYTHISPRKIKFKKIYDTIEAGNVFEETQYKRIFVGHNHISSLFVESKEMNYGAIELDVNFGKWIKLNRNDRYIISCGAVGYSRDGSNTIRCGVYDHIKDMVKFLQVSGPVLPI